MTLACPFQDSPAHVCGEGAPPEAEMLIYSFSTVLGARGLGLSLSPSILFCLAQSVAHGRESRYI